MPAKEALERLDALIAELIEADQTGGGAEPLHVAQQLGQLRSLLVEGQSVLPHAGGEMHFRCDSCGIISHAHAQPPRCPACGGEKLYRADLASRSPTAG